MRLSILEQSVLNENSTAEQAIGNTLRVADAADQLGYHRVWLSEHHNMSILQGSVPEVLLGAIGSRTTRIRVGSGGVMLSNHSPYHVAESFRTLEAIAPGRVDCGLGRASGGDAYSTALLSTRSVGTVGDFVEGVDALDRFFHDECKRAMATPAVHTVPPMWLLSGGGSPKSGTLAAEKGLGLVLALFINPGAEVAAATEYRRTFRPSAEFPEPKIVLAVNCVCSGDPEVLADMQKGSDYFRLMRDSGNYPQALPSPDRLKAFTVSEEARSYLTRIGNREVSGTPEEVRRQIEEKLVRYQADEMMLSILAYNTEDKLQTMSVLAKTCGLEG